MWYHILSFVLGAVTYRVLMRWPVEGGGGASLNVPLERLKNALLTFALMYTDKDKVDSDLDYHYDKFDGTHLPAMAGADLTHACFTYIVDKQLFRRDPWYTVTMERKVDAINRYLDTQLGTDDQVVEFFNRFLAEIAPAEKDKEKAN